MDAIALFPIGGRHPVHIDIGDGIYTPERNWGDPVAIAEVIKSQTIGVELGIHLMSSKPEIDMMPWLSIGIKKLILPVETITDHAYISSICGEHDIEPFLSVSTKTPIEVALEYKDFFPGFLLLAVDPGPAGQMMDMAVIPRIIRLKAAVPSATIEVDGGVDLETVGMLKRAGADVAVSGTYIFSDPDPVAAYSRLASVAE